MLFTCLNKCILYHITQNIALSARSRARPITCTKQNESVKRHSHLVGSNGLEPSTFIAKLTMWGIHNHTIISLCLSTCLEFTLFVIAIGLSLVKNKTRASSDTLIWWEAMDSNHRPHAYQACALTSWASFPKIIKGVDINMGLQG